MGGTRVARKVAHHGFDDVVGLAFDQIRRASFTSGQVAVLDGYLEITRRAIDANRPPSADTPPGPALTPSPASPPVGSPTSRMPRTSSSRP